MLHSLSLIGIGVTLITQCLGDPFCPDPTYQTNLVQPHIEKQKSFYIFPVNLMDNISIEINDQLFPLGCIAQNDRLAELATACPNYKSTMLPLCFSRKQSGTNGCGKPSGCILIQKLTFGKWESGPSYCTGADEKHIGFVPVVADGCGLETSPMYEMHRSPTVNIDYPSYYYASGDADKLSVSIPATNMSYTSTTNAQFFFVWTKIPEGGEPPLVAVQCPDPSYMINLLQATANSQFYIFPADLKSEFYAINRYSLDPKLENQYGCIVGHDRLYLVERACPDYQDNLRPLCFRYNLFDSLRGIWMQKLKIGQWGTNYCPSQAYRHIGFVPITENWCRRTTPMYELLRDQATNINYPSQLYVSTQMDKASYTAPWTDVSFKSTTGDKPYLFVWQTEAQQQQPKCQKFHYSYKYPSTATAGETCVAVNGNINFTDQCVLHFYDGLSKWTNIKTANFECDEAGLFHINNLEGAIIPFYTTYSICC